MSHGLITDFRGLAGETFKRETFEKLFWVLTGQTFHSEGGVSGNPTWQFSAPSWAFGRSKPGLFGERSGVEREEVLEFARSSFGMPKYLPQSEIDCN